MLSFNSHGDNKPVELSDLAKLILKLFEEDKIYRNQETSLSNISKQLNSNNNYI